MKNMTILKKFVYPALAMSMILLPACKPRTDNAEQARADYSQSLTDSITAIQEEIETCNSDIETLRNEVGEMMVNFTTVSNPREVGSYTVLTSWRDRYPLSSTGLVARIDENNRFELVAALEGGTFDQITVQGPSVSASSDIVPNDQALNYRTASLTTVLYSGASADSIGALISDNALNTLNVIFVQSKPVRSWRLPGENANMIAITYSLYERMSELGRLERRVPMLHEKINLLRLHRDARQSDSTAR